MRKDVLDALSGRFPEKIPSKETLNHPGLVSLAAGFDVFEDSPRAFEIAWRRLGIDIHVEKPKGNAIRPKRPGGAWTEGNVSYSDLGVYPTSMPLEHLPGIPKDGDDWIYRYDPADDDFDAETETKALKAASSGFLRSFGSEAVMYRLYYTTLFMWPVVKFGWEPFMLNAIGDPARFDKRFLEPWTEISRKRVECLCAMDEDVIFTHDDLAMSTGPVFQPEWYETHIFPRYAYIWEPIRKAAKKLVFVCDGKADAFLERLLDFPIDGIMLESPATSFELILETWGKAGRGFIGGISTALLTNGTPEEVGRHTRDVVEKGRRHPGFMISSCGGLHGNIPLENARAYFNARKEAGIPGECG